MNTPGPHAIWHRAALRRQVLRQRHDGKTQTTLGVATLETGWQALRLEQYLGAVTGVSDVEVNTAARRVHVLFDPTRTHLPQLLDTCDRAGCAARPLPRDDEDDSVRHQADTALKRLLVAGICAMQSMMFALVLYLDMVDPVDTTTVQLFRWLGLLSCTPVVLYAGVPFFRHALADVRARRPGIDVPIALAIGLIYLASTINTVRGHGHIWFDSAAMLIFVLLLGRYLEQRARHRHQAVTRASDHAAPLTVTRHGIDGAAETVAVAELVPGDCIHVAEGGVVPVDGVLESADARLDTSLHSGESRPQARTHGDVVAAGSVVLDGSLRLRVTHVGADTRLAQLQELTRAARRRHMAADGPDLRSVSGYTAGLLLLAGATLAFWLFRDPSRAFDATVAVLVVACPCAFALAAPATLTRAMALLAHHGVRVTRPRALPALARADHAVCDKTGTLTRPGIRHHVLMPRAPFASETDVLAAAVALARESRHPLACALAAAHADRITPAVEQVRVSAGQGISGVVHGHHVSLGRPRTNGTRDDGQALWLEDADGVLARFDIAETPRAGAAHTLAALRRHGVTTHLVSGDAHARVDAMADRLGMADARARQSPADKHDYVHELQRENHVVLAVGDGTNDAAALAAADVSASLVDATDLARQHADLLLEGSLDGLVQARRMAQRAVRTLRQNRAWGLTWNLVALPFAAAGAISPWVAAVGMSASSLIVVLNVLRMQSPRTVTVARVHALHERTA